MTSPSNARLEIHDVGFAMNAIAQNHGGSISVAFHQSNDLNETMMYWEK
jgi:hypothetical protein